MSIKISSLLKVVVAAAAIATAVASPVLAQSAQDSGGTYYHGYPLKDWHTQDSW
jgi:hypothetical protein